MPIGFDPLQYPSLEHTAVSLFRSAKVALPIDGNSPKEMTASIRFVSIADEAYVPTADGALLQKQPLDFSGHGW